MMIVLFCAPTVICNSVLAYASIKHHFKHFLFAQFAYTEKVMQYIIETFIHVLRLIYSV